VLTIEPSMEYAPGSWNLGFQIGDRPFLGRGMQATDMPRTIGPEIKKSVDLTNSGVMLCATVKRSNGNVSKPCPRLTIDCSVDHELDRDRFVVLKEQLSWDGSKVCFQILGDTTHK
jgi:hypothetical protein